MTEITRRKVAACQYRCGVRVYKFHDEIGRLRQVNADPLTEPIRWEQAHHIWYVRSRWVGWIPLIHARKGAAGKTLHIEHQCGTSVLNTPR